MIISFFIVAPASLLAVLACETVHRQSLGLTIKWIKTALWSFVFNSALLAAITMLFTGLTGNFPITCTIIFIVYYLLSCVSFFKYAARNEPLYFYDFIIAFKVMGVAGSSNLIITKYVALPFLFEGLLLAGVFLLMPAGAGTSFERLLAAAVSLAVIIPLLCQSKDDLSYRKKGLLCGLALNGVLYFKKVKPESSGFPAAIKNTEKDDGAKPNIIVLLSESFFDITRVPGLKLSAEPVPFFKSLKEKTVSGTLLVTPIGGGTCAVEAEFLTGCVMRHFNLTKPFYYSRNISGVQSVPGLPGFLKERGYETSALHTYKKTFYNRDKAFACLGFDRFLGLEDLKAPKYDGAYVSDVELTDMIIGEYQRKSGPAFIMGISMENHQPYTAKKYQSTDIKVQNGEIPEKLRKEAESYIHGLTHADRELERLVGFLEKQEEPSVLLFFGDHLGALGAGLDFYRKTGYIGDKDELSGRDILNVYSPDFVIWSNYKEEKSRYEYVGANFLPNILLNYIGTPEKPELFYALDMLFEKMRGLSRPDVFVDAEGRVYDKIPDELIELENMYKACEHKNILRI